MKKKRACFDASNISGRLYMQYVRILSNDIRMSLTCVIAEPLHFYARQRSRLMPMRFQQYDVSQRHRNVKLHFSMHIEKILHSENNILFRNFTSCTFPNKNYKNAMLQRFASTAKIDI